MPWQQLAWEKGAKLRVIPVDDSGQVLFDEYLKLLTPRTKIVSVSQVSNALGTVTPVKAIVEQAKRNGVRALVDGAQAVSHMRVDVREIDCDWYVFSGHKVFGPTGIGVLYGREDLLNASPPWQGGGNMIKDVTFERTLYQASRRATRPARATSPTRSGSGRRSTTSRRSAWTRSMPTSINCSATPPTACRNFRGFV